MNQTWDSVTAPALPADWSSPGNVVTTVTTGPTPISSPNMIFVQGSGGAAKNVVMRLDPDGHAGQIQVIGTGNLYNSIASNCGFSVLARCNSSSFSFASGSGYELELTGTTFAINRYNSGSQTTPFSLAVTGMATDQWYQITGDWTGESTTSVFAAVTRLSDGYTLNMSTGTFESGSLYVIYNDSTSPVTGEGYVGWAGFAPLHGQVYGDDFQFNEIGIVLLGDEAGDAFAGSSAVSTSATAGPTESHDAFAGTAGFRAAAVLSRAEAHDAFAGAALAYVAGLLANTETHDAFAGSAGFRDLASIAVTEHGDALAGAGAFAGSAAMAATEGHDMLASWATVTPRLLAIERHDVLAAAATSGASLEAAISAVESRDTLASSAGFSYDTRAGLGTVERGDVFAGVAIQSAAASIGPAERGDIFAGSVALANNATMAVTEAHDIFRAGLERVEYHVYANTGAGDPINYGNPIDTTAGLTYTTDPLAYPGVWSFGVRAFYVVSGLEEQNLDCAVTIVLDSTGRDVTSRPAPPVSLRAFPLAGGEIRAEWTYAPTYGPRTPTGFHVYTGVGALTYTTPTATVLWGSGVANSFVANMTGFSGGTTYTVGVRAYNAVAEEPNTNTVTVTAISAGPAPVDGLVGVATSAG